MFINPKKENVMKIFFSLVAVTLLVVFLTVCGHKVVPENKNTFHVESNLTTSDPMSNLSMTQEYQYLNGTMLMVLDKKPKSFERLYINYSVDGTVNMRFEDSRSPNEIFSDIINQDRINTIKAIAAAERHEIEKEGCISAYNYFEKKTY